MKYKKIKIKNQLVEWPKFSWREGTELISLVLEAAQKLINHSDRTPYQQSMIQVRRSRLINTQKPNCAGMHRKFHNERTYQNPSIVKFHQLRFELENQHEEDPAHDDATVLDNQRSLGHCGKSVRRIRDANMGRNNRFLFGSGH